MSLQKTILPIGGMNCASCAQTIEKALKKVDGVTSAAVNIATEKATVDYDDAKINLDQIKKTINDTGYEVEE